MEIRLTKTDFIHYLKCPESLWLEKNKPEETKKGEVSLFLQKIIDEGYEVEAFAEKLFPDAFGLPDKGTIQDTSEALKLPNTQFFQATFKTKDGVYARVDILERLSEDTWHLYEVKSSSEVSTKKSHNHIYDACFQKYVLEENGLKIDKVSIIHLNKEYRKEGEIVPKSLLKITDVTTQVNEVFDSISQQIQEALAYINQNEINENQCSCLRKTRSNHCDNFFYFNSKLPEHPVHEIKRITENKLNSLLDLGCQGLAEVPDDLGLNSAQKAQIKSLLQERPQIAFEPIKKQLGGLEFPLHFYDYETYASAIPKLDGIGPHQHVPFQVSIHTLHENGELIHFEHLAEKLEMPKKMIEEMEAFTGQKGTFVSWHASFENSRNKDMKQWLSEHADYLDYINAHTFDLEGIFTEDYIDYGFRGSSSIKKVLPVLLDKPELKYDSLEVQDGTMAMDVWGRLVLEKDLSEEEIKQTRKELLAYCELDTLAMVEIYQYLIKLTNP